MAQGRSPWVYVGIGCGALLLIVVVAVAIGGFAVFQGFKKLGEEMNDPVAREARVKRVLGAEELPNGYHAGFAMSIPRVMELAMLGSRPPGATGENPDLGERGLIYVEFIGRQNEARLRDYFEGRTSDPDVLSQSNIQIDAREILQRGVIPSDTRTLMYVTQRGSVSSYGVKGDGITSVILVDCPGDRRTRMAIWFGPDTEPNAESSELDLTGTPGDEVEIASFMGHFRVCP